MSLTSAGCDVMERFVCDGILVHLVRNKILNKIQLDFQPKRSPLTSMLCSSHYTFTLIDIKVVFLDLLQVFDILNQRLLLAQLEELAALPILRKWIATFLIKHPLKVRVDDELSPYFPVSRGVSQGSVLGPLLFSYIHNDFPVSNTLRCYMFADDAKLICSTN